MPNLILSGRKLWTMKCESLFQIMASSLSTGSLAKLCRKSHLPLPTHTASKADLYQWSHEQCHRESPFSRHMQRYLDRAHAAVLARLRSQDLHSIRQTVETLVSQAETTLPTDLAGIIWAVASDPRQEIRPVEDTLVNGLHLLSHCLLLTRLQGEAYVVAPVPAAATLQDTGLLRQVTRLQTKCRTLRTSVTSLTQENDRLRHHIQALTRHPAALHQAHTARTTPHGTHQRDLKKLHYQVDKLTALVDEKEHTILQLRSLLQASEGGLRVCGTPPDSQQRPSTPSAGTARGLQGKTVALVGGLGRAVPHYQQTVQEFGCCCLYHNGNLHQGEKKLAEIVRQADMVFCMLNHNSHLAATCAKKLCKALHKPCYFLQSSGISGVRDKLLELTAQY